MPYEPTASDILLDDPDFRRSIETSLDQLSASKEAAAIWCTAGIATFSAGALAFTLSSPDRLEHPILVAALFLVGVALSFGSFVSIAHYNNAVYQGSDALLDIIKLPNGSRDAEVTAAAWKDLSSAQELTNVVAAFVIGALFAILLGVVAFAMNFKTGDKYNDLRCMAIQKDMLSAHSRMSSPSDAFQALGCRPQGKDFRIFVPPTDRERAAGKPLPWGGYSPPL